MVGNGGSCWQWATVGGQWRGDLVVVGILSTVGAVGGQWCGGLIDGG